MPAKKQKSKCCLKTKPFYQCCCKCEHLLKDCSHPTTDGKPISHQIGWICNAFAYEGIAHSGWSEHSIGCEMYQRRETEEHKKKRKEFGKEFAKKAMELAEWEGI